MSLFSSPKPVVQQEDPAVAAARARAQTQSDNSLTLSIQDDLRRKMQARQQQFGLAPTSASSAAGSRPAITSGFMAPI